MLGGGVVRSGTALDEDKVEEYGGSLVVDDALADIVLVNKNEMEHWLSSKSKL